MKGSKASLGLNTVGPLVQPVNYVNYHLSQESKISETEFGAPKASQMSLGDSENSLRRVRQPPDAPQQILITRIRANDAGVAPERAIARIFVTGAVSGDRSQNGLGWLAGRELHSGVVALGYPKFILDPLCPRSCKVGW